MSGYDNFSVGDGGISQHHTMTRLALGVRSSVRSRTDEWKVPRTSSQSGQTPPTSRLDWEFNRSGLVDLVEAGHGNFGVGKIFR